ncbi:hypothetical protein U1Q18_017375 [Sarracenia purpurea var. burkii]
MSKVFEDSNCEMSVPSSSAKKSERIIENFLGLPELQRDKGLPKSLPPACRSRLRCQWSEKNVDCSSVDYDRVLGVNLGTRDSEVKGWMDYNQSKGRIKSNFSVLITSTNLERGMKNQGTDRGKFKISNQSSECFDQSREIEQLIEMDQSCGSDNRAKQGMNNESLNHGTDVGKFKHACISPYSIKQGISHDSPNQGLVMGMKISNHPPQTTKQGIGFNSSNRNHSP